MIFVTCVVGSWHRGTRRLSPRHASHIAVFNKQKIITHFVHICQYNIQGLFKDFQGHKHSSEGPKNAKPSFENPKFIIILHFDKC